ncbi:SGNH/GDSL hydrolase family protein [Haloferula sp.]|uniref:SGNH/GDSL hydrolase family protein n=1 Tax=Haloferula sp. TaxID=2497595 RepID=UPI00329DB5ED
MKVSLLLVVVLAGLVGGFVRAESAIRSGDRIALVGNTFADQLRVHGYLEAMLLRHDFEEAVSVRNLGWAGDMLTARDRPTNFPSEVETLSSHQTDVIIACFGMGESFAGVPGIEIFKKDLGAFLVSHEGKSYNGKSEVRLVLVSPIACEDLGTTTPGTDRRNSELESYSMAMKEVADEAGVPFVDLFGPMRDLLSEGGAAEFTTNGIHLNDLGYWAVSQAFFDQLVGENRTPWRISVDAGEMKVTASGVQVAGVNGDEESFSFSVKELTAPNPAPPIEVALSPWISARRDTVTVTGFAEGSYELMVDGVSVATARHDEWAAGVAIDRSPAHREAENFRKAVKDKNLQFLYGWKALNQVHIVGERKNSSSGRALPAELIEFDKLAKRKDEVLRKGYEPQTRTWSWKLVPALK